jgi:Ohr subfamily peroxiredoxin
VTERLYTAQATADSARTGRSRSSDGRLDVQLSRPVAMGGDDGPGTNPEQLFAAGYAACFHSAMRHALRPLSLRPNASVSPGLLVQRTALSLSRDMTYAEVLVEAASAHLADLPPPFEAAPPASVGMPTRAARRLPEPGVQVQLWLDGHQLRWLDDQVTRLQAPSYTALVLALLRAHLGALRCWAAAGVRQARGNPWAPVTAPSG